MTLSGVLLFVISFATWAKFHSAINFFLNYFSSFDGFNVGAITVGVRTLDGVVGSAVTVALTIVVLGGLGKHIQLFT